MNTEHVNWALTLLHRLLDLSACRSKEDISQTATTVGWATASNASTS